MATLSSIAPTSRVAGSYGSTIVLTGTGFVATDVVRIDGDSRLTTYISATELRAALLMEDLAAARSASLTVASAGGGVTSAQTLTITAADPIVPAEPPWFPNGAPPPPPPPPFAPSDVAGLLLWFDADALALADGAAVASWADRSAMARHATQASGGSQPVCRTGVLNGRRVVRFTGTQQMAFSPLGLPTTGSRTILAVVRPSDASTRFVWIGYGSPGVNFKTYDVEASTYNQAGRIAVHIWDALWGATGATLDAGVGNLIGLGYAGGATFSTTRVFSNGAELATMDVYGGNAGGPPAILDTGLDSGYLGNRPVFALSGGDHDLAEVVLYAANLATGDRQKIEGYLAWKWGLVARLPGGHPYKLAAPE